MGIAVSSSGRPPILGRLRLPRAPPTAWGTVASAGTCDPRLGRGLAPRGVVPTARVGAAIPLASVDAPGPPTLCVTTWRTLTCPRPETDTGPRGRLPAHGRIRPVLQTLARRRCMPRMAGSPHRRLVPILLGRPGFADGWVAGMPLATRTPGPRTNRSLPRTPLGTRALRGAWDRAMRPCRLPGLTPLPLVPWRAPLWRSTVGVVRPPCLRPL